MPHLALRLSGAFDAIPGRPLPTDYPYIINYTALQLFAARASPAPFFRPSPLAATAFLLYWHSVYSCSCGATSRLALIRFLTYVTP